VGWAATPRTHLRGVEQQAISTMLRTMATACAAVFLLYVPTAVAQQAPAGGEKLDGEALFATTCGWCHADGGREAGKGPKLANSQRSDEFIVQRIKHGKEGAMPAFGNTYNDEQIAEIIKYVRSLKDDPG